MYLVKESRPTIQNSGMAQEDSGAELAGWLNLDWDVIKLGAMCAWNQWTLFLTIRSIVPLEKDFSAQSLGIFLSERKNVLLGK